MSNYVRNWSCHGFQPSWCCQAPVERDADASQKGSWACDRRTATQDNDGSSNSSCFGHKRLCLWKYLLETTGFADMCENTRAAWQLFFTARTWAKPHRFDSSVTLLLRRAVQSKTQWHLNVFKLLKLLQKSSQASKTFFQLLQIKRLQLKLTNNLQNSYQISSQHQVPKTWVKQHPKTPKTTKTNENPSPSSSMHKLVPFGSKLVPTWFL